MIRKFTRSATLLTLFLAASFACKQSNVTQKDPALVYIDSLEKAMKLATEKNPAEPDLNLAMYLAKAYQNYEAGHPNDSLSPKFLFKAGQVVENVFDDKQRAAELYFMIYKKYPGSGSAPYALFMTGNLYHTVRDTVHAVEMLEFFMAKYPDHKLKMDAAALIKSLGVEPDTSSRPVKDMPFSS
jgi:tetratricopeptide (TPR) repeat protein